MRILNLIVALSFVLPVLAVAPVASAAPQCQTFERSVPVAAVTATAHTRSCYDSYTSTTWSYRLWTNLTHVTVSAVSGESASLVMANVHIEYVISGQVTDYYGHDYYVVASDPDGAATRYLVAGAGNGQVSGPSGCAETTFATARTGGPAGSTQVWQHLYGGSNAPAILPCTSEDVQRTLP